MPRFIKGLLFGLVAVFLLGVAALWWAGPDWRALIANAPSGRDVLSWDIGQRDAAFRMMDRIPVLSDVNEMQPSDAPKPLEEGAPLSLSVDVDAYMAQGRYASLVILHNGKIRLEKYAMGFDAGGRWT
ncbi:MAG: serine hydrolase, partial [Pseudomonadota bacterium]